ncbi:helix-turn-helix domain-containing protein [Clostridium tyrobutyricum]|uniref:helix-turn-helix domain-containing protein n=1 Tax=Clostridium tyrobutyricum TaxID=1519 RepID=UPI00073D74DD|nr:XRE family transcriptional regulator [Clostridium tyrobutyricum]MBV4441514.1 helix-turn-helix domain-containing protein [Clostridium tyrobutyricum]
MNIENKLGEKIKYYRKNLKLTQEQLAQKSGLSRNAIYNYENNRRSPDMETLNKIAKALDTNVYNLIDNDTTLTSKLIKLFEETICKNCDARNTLEIISELIDIDEEVINKAMEDEEDISESYLVCMIDQIFKDSPGTFEKFYKKNKNFIFSRYDMVNERCSELNIKYLKYLNYLTALNTESPSKHISNLYQKAKNNTLTSEDVKVIEDYKQLELMNKRIAYIKKLHEKNPLDKQIADLYEKSKSMSLTEEDIKNIDGYRQGEIASIKLFDDIDMPRIDSPQNESYELFKKMLKSMRYDINKIETIPLFRKIKKQIELEIEFMNDTNKEHE